MPCGACAAKADRGGTRSGTTEAVPSRPYLRGVLSPRHISHHHVIEPSRVRPFFEGDVQYSAHSL
jgi:hypothetical protein